MSALSISLVPGALPEDGDVIDNSVLRAIARPTIALAGSIGTATIDDDSITTVKLKDGVLSADATGRAKMADGFITAAKLATSLDLTGKTVTLPAGTLLPAGGIQTVSASTGAVASLTAAMVYDDTIPQNTEGTAIAALDVAITPRSDTSVLEITVLLNVNGNSANAQIIVALFQDGIADALAAVVDWQDNNGSDSVLTLVYRMTSGTTSATTFKVRAGATSGNVTVNGATGLRKLGGVLKSWMIVKEL